jgi:nitrate/nitrite transporter NarK
LGYGSADIGKILTAITAGIVISCIISGKISDFVAARTRRKDLARIWVLAAGQILIIVSVCLIVFGDMRNQSLFFCVAFLFAFAASWGLGSFYCIIPELFDAKTIPVVTGIAGGVGDAGMPIAPFVVGVCFGIRGFWNIGWGSCAVVAAISLVAVLFLMLLLRSNARRLL